MAKEVKENKALKHPTVKCHGKFKTSRQYVARSINDKGIDVRFDDELVYLGFGHWKKNTKEAK